MKKLFLFVLLLSFTNSVALAASENTKESESIEARWGQLLQDENVTYFSKWKRFYYYDKTKIFGTDGRVDAYCDKISAGGLKWKSVSAEDGNYDSFFDLGKEMLKNKSSRHIIGLPLGRGYIKVFMIEHRGEMVARTKYINGRLPHEFYSVCVARVKDKVLTQ
jgi:hypothetical protein